MRAPLPQPWLLVSSYPTHYVPLSITSTPAAPSAPPSSVTVTSVSSSTITVQWRSVPCIHQNGDITGYRVRYRSHRSGSSLQIMTVDRDNTTEATITGLRSSTTYSIEVAVVNSAGTGVYSEPKVNRTLPSKGVMLFKIHAGSLSSFYRCLL